MRERRVEVTSSPALKDLAKINLMPYCQYTTSALPQEIQTFLAICSQEHAGHAV